MFALEPSGFCLGVGTGSTAPLLPAVLWLLLLLLALLEDHVCRLEDLVQAHAGSLVQIRLSGQAGTGVFHQQNVCGKLADLGFFT